MAKRKAKLKNGGDSGPQPEASSPAGKTKAPPARAGTYWILSLLGALCAGLVVLWIVNPFAQPEEEPPPPDPPPQPLTAEGLKEEMIEVARGQMAVFPDDPSPVIIMGNVHAMLGRHAKAVAWYQRALGMNPLLAEAQYRMAEVAISRGEYELAVEQYRKALAIDPDLAGANGRLGHAFMESGRPEEAVAALKTELKHHPDAFKFELALGQAYLQMKQFEQALPHLERAVKGMPKYPPAHYALARAYTRLKQREKAAGFMERYRQLQDAETERQRKDRKEEVDFVNATRAAADIHTTAGRMYATRHRPVKARAHWQRAAFLDRSNAQCRELLSDSYMRRQKWSDVLALQRELLESYPDNPVYHLNKGVALFYLGKPDESEKALRDGIRLAPEVTKGYHNLLQVLMVEDRKLIEAKAVAEKLVELEPTARNYTMLSSLCLKTGDEAGARAAGERARTVGSRQGVNR